MLLGIATGTAFLVVLYHPLIKNKAGPDWIWAWGRCDPVRNAIFRQDGSIRRYSRVILTVVLVPQILAAVAFLVVTLCSILNEANL